MGRTSRRRVCIVTAPHEPTTSAPATAAHHCAWDVRRSRTDGATKANDSASVSRIVVLRPTATPMMRPVNDTTTASSRPAPVTAYPEMTSSTAEAMVRPGSSATIPPATMKAKSLPPTGSQPCAPSAYAAHASAVATKAATALE